MYGQTILTCQGGAPGSGMDVGGLDSSLAGISCGGGGGMGIYETTSYGMGGTGTFPGQNGLAYTPGETGLQSGNGGLNNLGEAPILGNQSGSGGAGGGLLESVMLRSDYDQVYRNIPQNSRSVCGWYKARTS